MIVVIKINHKRGLKWVILLVRYVKRKRKGQDFASHVKKNTSFAVCVLMSAGMKKNLYTMVNRCVNSVLPKKSKTDTKKIRSL